MQKGLTIIFLILFLLGISIPAYAKDFGKVGETYPIKEVDLLDFIQARLAQMQQNGELAKINKQIMDTLKKRAEQPEPVKGITTTKKYRSWLIDPSITFDHDILDTEGHVIVKKGTVVNPFKNITLKKLKNLKKAYIFYDGDNKDQVAWVIKKDKQLQCKDKLILINGCVANQSKLFKKKIYFDQHGRLTNKFKIKHTPAVVTQEEMQFKVEELVP